MKIKNINRNKRRASGVTDKSYWCDACDLCLVKDGQKCRQCGFTRNKHNKTTDKKLIVTIEESME